VARNGAVSNGFAYANALKYGARRIGLWAAIENLSPEQLKAAALAALAHEPDNILFADKGGQPSHSEVLSYGRELGRIYRSITGKSPGYSTKNEAQRTGPAVRFFQCCLEPVLFNATPNVVVKIIRAVRGG
jgi:hypothetical protein